MTARFKDLVFTPEVLRQQQHGSRKSNAGHAATSEGSADPLGPREAMFLAARDSVYLASNSAIGWPYIQHRGGPPGFIKRLDDRMIGFADYRGNRQYVSLGNVATDDRVALFAMDYPGRSRLKLLGRMRPIDLTATPSLAAALVDASYGAKVERGFVIAVEAFDWNCPQHITPRYTQPEVDDLLAPLRARIVELERANAVIIESQL